MLSSLVPGAIFQTSGLNRKSTPTPRNVTPSELDYRYRRDNINGTDWPHDSPVSRMYDVANTSTSLIILNNKYGKNSTRLRGYYSGPSTSDRFIDPNRHRAKSPRNPDHHYRCLDSSSPKFEPQINTGMEWSNSLNRPPSSLIAKSSVNPRRHESCRVRHDGPPSPVGDRPRSQMSLPPPKYFSDYSDMSVGETLYMWSIEKIYNVENLKQLKQKQYRKLLQLEAKKGYHGYTDYAKYLRYINNAPNRTYGTGTGTPRAPSTPRSKSAFSNRSTSGRASPVKTPESRGDKQKEKDSASDKSDEPEPAKRPQTSIPTTRHEDKKDEKQEKKDKQEKQGTQDKQEKQETQEKSKSTKPKEDKTTKGQGSRSPSRSSRSSLQNLGSMRSLRSKGSSRPSSRSSSIKSAQSRDHVQKVDKQDHREGGDRPKSRIGRISDDGPSKSQTSADDRKTTSKDKASKHNDKPNSLSSSSSSLDKQDKMGSISSINSKNSDSSVENSKKQEQEKSSLNEKNDVKVHRIPSAVDVKEDLDDEGGVDVKDVDNNANGDDDNMNQTESKNPDESQTKEAEKSVKFSGIKDDPDNNKTDEEKSEVKDVIGNLNKSDDAKESEVQVTKTETKNKLSRQDSFDEDDDRRANRDLDQIEY